MKSVSTSKRLSSLFTLVRLNLALGLVITILGALTVSIAYAGNFSEIEPNDSLATAQNIDGGSWDLVFDPDIGDTTSNTSTTIPHISILGTGNDTYDWYAFTVANAGDRGIFDNDYSNGWDTYLLLYNSAGAELARNDDNSTSYGQGGSTTGLDSYLEYTFTAPGTYFIVVGRYISGGHGPVPSGRSYELQVSVGPNPEIDVQGNGQSIADGDATPSTTDYTDFGNTSVAGGQIIRTFTIRNNGGANLNLTGFPLISLAGPAASDFSVTANPTSPVSPGGTTIFQVTFDPSALGVRSATLSIANNDSNENPYDFAIQGTGTIPTIQFTQATYQINEDGTAIGATITLTRTGDIGAASQVQVSFTDDTATGSGVDYTSTPIDITFPAGDSSPQTMTVPITQDALDENTEALTMTVASVSNAQIGSQDTAALQIVDDDTAGTVVSPTSLTISEPSGSDAFNISLTSQPTATVTIDLSSSDLTECTVPASVNILPAEWQTGMTVTVSAIDDLISDGNQPCTVQTISNSSDPVYDAISMDDVNVTVNDDEVQGVTITESGGSTSVTEGGSTDTYTVQLNTIPTDTVTIAFNTGTQVQPITSLTFDPDSSALDPQPVTVTAVDDTVVEGDHSQIISHSASGGGYDGVSVNNVTAVITDNDISYTLAANDPTVTEGDTGSTAISFTLTRTGDITRSSAVNFALGGTASGGSDYTNVSPAPGTVNFAAGQTSRDITLDVLGDYVDESDETIIVSLSAATGTGGGGTGTISGSPATTTITDDDTAGTVVNPTSLTTSELSGSDAFNIHLTSQPTATVTINLSSSDLTECIVPASVSILPLDWQTGVTVTVTAEDEFIDDGDQPCTVETTAVSSDGKYDAIAVDNVDVTVQDDDDAGTVVNPTSLTISEPSGTDTFNIHLTSQPTATVTVDLSSSDTGECTVPASVNLTSLNWQTGVTVTVSAVDDLISDGDQPCPVETTALSSDPLYDAIAVDEVDVTVNDDEVRGVTITESSGSTNVTEGGATDTYTIQLNTVPTASVTISLATGSQINLVADLTFTADLTALDPQTVTIAATDDIVVEGDHSQIISHSASGGGYDGVSISTMTAAITDNDLAYAISAGQTAVTEGNSGVATISFTITRSGAITTTTGNVNFNLSGTANGSDYNNVSPTPGAVSFTAGQTQRQITLDALGDFNVELDETIIVTLSDPSAPGSGTATITTPSAQTTITNDDSAGFTITPTTGLTTTEAGGVASFTVRLNSQPSVNVTVTLISSDPTEGTPSPAALVFSPANWNSNQTVTVTGQDDPVADGDLPYTIQTGAASSDPDYSGLDPADVALTNLDDDTPGYTISPNSFALSEGGSQVVSFALYTPPTADVTINLSSNDLSECTVSPASITLNASNWQSGASFTVEGVNDDLDDGVQPCTIATTVNSSDSAYGRLDPDDIDLTVFERRIFLPLIFNNFVAIPDLVIVPGSLSAGSGGVSLQVQNVGMVAVVDTFWVDVYFNPTQTPTVNKPWKTIAPAGAVWGVTKSLVPGETLTLMVGGAYYDAGRSSASFPANAQVYAYVDSINHATSYGNVRESHEANNLAGPVVSTAEVSGQTFEVLETSKVSSEGLPGR